MATPDGGSREEDLRMRGLRIVSRFELCQQQSASGSFRPIADVPGDRHSSAMNDLLWSPLIFLPVLVALLAGAWTHRSTMMVRLGTLILVSLYPLPHWYLLRFVRETFLDMNVTTRVVAGQLSALLMVAEFVICPLAFLAAFGIGRAMVRRG